MTVECKIIINGNEIKLPSLEPSDPPATLTDYRKQGEEIVVINCADDDSKGEVYVSKAGVSLDLGNMRLLHSDDLQKEADVFPGQEYERHLTTRMGEAILRISHTPATVTTQEFQA